MILNEHGTIAYNEWAKTPELRKNVELDVFAIMPNHLHRIIIVNTTPSRGECNSPQSHSNHLGQNEWHSPNLDPPNIGGWAFFMDIFNIPLRRFLLSLTRL